VHELEYLLHLEDIDQKIKQYSRTKPDLWIDETKPLKEQLQFREGLETKKERSKYRRSKNAVYFILAFFGSYTPYVMWTEKWYISVFFSIGMGILFATSIVLAFMQLVLDGRVQDAQKLHKSISEYWANQSD
ncbi:MAG: hypothetical protein VXY56_09220, partial [Pseudomonadota bacterium]|nr:hypothetical protein [Pseudomonadota bacterium]